MKDITISIRLDKEELRCIQTEAKKSNMTRSELVRGKLLNQPITVVDNAPKIAAALCTIEQALAACDQADNANVREGMDQLWQCLRK